MVVIVLWLLVAASFVYWMVALWLVRSFFHRPRPAAPEFYPPVSILKPLRGLDAQIYQNFVSFCEQDYPEFELVFGVADPDDPVAEAVRRLQREYPQCDTRLVITPANRANRKAAQLHVLAGEARYPVLVISDSDMRVGPDYLRRVVPPLADPTVGLVTCLYRGVEPVTFTARMEALYMGATFLPSVLVARKVLKMRFALGATVALRGSDLERMGGFAAVADYLADDYQLGAHIADLGLRVQMSDYIVNSVLGATTFTDQWNREVRWAHCNRVSRPLEYPGMLLTFGTTFSLVLVVASGFAPTSWVALGLSLLQRWFVAWWVMGYTGNESTRRWVAWLPLRDALSALVWAAGAVGRRVVWRGEEYILQPDGKLASPRPVGQHLWEGGCPAPLKKVIGGVDVLLQHTRSIEEFSEDERCFLRISLGESERDLTLSDGTEVRHGDPIGRIYLWNDRIPQIPPEGPDLGWALAFQRQAEYSLRLLAAYVRESPGFADVNAFIGEITFGGPYDPLHGAVLARRWGFDAFSQDRMSRRRGRFVESLRHLHTLFLIWVFNPGSMVKGRRWRMRRDELWMSRRVLLQKYGPSEREFAAGDGFRGPPHGRKESRDDRQGLVDGRRESAHDHRAPIDGMGSWTLERWPWSSERQ
jgi:ceramide glucosyltransferase